MALVLGAMQPFVKVTGYNGGGRPSGLTNQLWLVPIVFGCVVWGRRPVRKVILVQCDNTGVVLAIKMAP